MNEPRVGQVFTWRPTRRQFLAGAGGAAAVAGLSGLAAGLPGQAQASAPGFSGSVGAKVVFTLCEMCVWRCGVKARV